MSTSVLHFSRGRIQADEYMAGLLLGHVQFGLPLLHADVYTARLLLPHVHFGVALLHADEYKWTNTWLDSS